MVNAKPAELTSDARCLRIHGRAEVALRGFVETPQERVPCWVRDLSLGGAQVEVEEHLAPDQLIWLSIRKLRIFGTVKWVRSNLAGLQFEEKLPKSVVMNLRGEVVDPEALAEVEAMLAAQNWVVGTPMDRPKSMRIADVLGSRGRGPDQQWSAGGGVPERSGLQRSKNDRGLKRRAAAIIALSAAIGLLLGLGSVLIF